ncbi:uncharacterized protein MKK02DRAFT_45782 [Dioszegia hungarica]|uniref:ABM domain-containing protein n=1 Tax=Dioszegia hungarica TaxID=4972 RepID=A0AA38H9Y3_9TREE|nr:uncharacterized protein MKK02DRAFT_45782 [Dioszegia hungarica]KAI9637073.1 hypothetical protein MKK02DRAFT_45782 [Dioszegia hungarica]
MSFIQLVTINAKEGKGAEIRRHLEQVYEDVKANEPGTKKYHIGVDTKNSDTIWLWEEYESDAALQDVHRKGKPYLEFMSQKDNLIGGFQIQRLDKVN